MTVVESSAMLARTQLLFPGNWVLSLSSATVVGSIFVFSYYQGFRLCLQLLPGVPSLSSATARGSVLLQPALSNR